MYWPMVCGQKFVYLLQLTESQSSCPGPNLAPVQACDLNVDGHYGLNVSLPQIPYVGSPNPQHLRI